MNDMKSKFKYSLTLITYVFILLLIGMNLGKIGTFILTFKKVLSPFIIGFILAFLLKGVVNFIENKILLFEKAQKFNKFVRFKRPIAIVIAYIFVIELFMLFSVIVIPQVSSSVVSLVSELPNLYNNFTLTLTDFIRDLPVSQEFWMETWVKVEEWGLKLFSEFGKMLYGMIPSLIDTTKNIGSSLSSLFFGVIISVYMLNGKEKFKHNVKLVLKAWLPDKIENSILKVGSMCNKAFSCFILGQITEAFILGFLCFIGMRIFKLPYAPLISIIIGVSNIIPIFGPIVGTVPSTLLVLMENPSEPMIAVYFVVLILIIQRIDNDVIYPRVIGNSIGLSGMWVMLSILVGGGLWGLTGMIVGVPLFSVIYQLVKEHTFKKLEVK